MKEEEIASFGSRAMVAGKAGRKRRLPPLAREPWLQARKEGRGDCLLWLESHGCRQGRKEEEIASFGSRAMVAGKEGRKRRLPPLAREPRKEEEIASFGVVFVL